VDSGYYAACAGLRAQSQALEVAANNLANLTTGGYRAQRATFQSLLAASSGGQTNNLNTAINDFGVLGGTHTDLSPGSLERTGNPLDLGIEGQGFFAVEPERGVLYTRSGNFHVSSQAKLVDAQGAVVQGAQGAMAVPAGVVSISPDGTLSVSGAVAGRLRVIDFASGTWAFVNVPKSEPRAGLAELALVILQLAGGIALAISSASIKDIRRSLKWSPLFILVFAVLTWIASWAAGPLHLFRSG